MKCAETRALLSPCLDGAVTGKQMHAVREHVDGCSDCRNEYLLLQRTQRMVTSLGRRQPPPDLALKLRVSLSREMAKQRRPLWAGISTRLENAFNAFMVPATAGVLSAVIFFGLLIGFFALPQQLRGESDVPTLLYTPPELKFSPFEIGMGINADSVVVEAYIDANGRVSSYRVVAGGDQAGQIRPQLDNMLIFTVFRPATSFGRPTASKTLLSFAKVNVRG